MIDDERRLGSYPWTGKWFHCRVESKGRSLYIKDAAEPTRGGMSGSPILAPDGAAIGVVCISSSIGDAEDDDREGGPNPLLQANLPAWLLDSTEGGEKMRDADELGGTLLDIIDRMRGGEEVPDAEVEAALSEMREYTKFLPQPAAPTGRSRNG